MASKLTPEQIENVKAAFAAIDTNGDGFISKDELKKLMAQSENEQEIARVWEIMDKNADGKIEFEEFLAFQQEYE